jgi:hypothetical protein
VRPIIAIRRARGYPTQKPLPLLERWYPSQVKQKDKAGRPDIDAFQAVMMREEVEKGFSSARPVLPYVTQLLNGFFCRGFFLWFPVAGVKPKPSRSVRKGKA